MASATLNDPVGEMSGAGTSKPGVRRVNRCVTQTYVTDLWILLTSHRVELGSSPHTGFDRPLTRPGMAKNLYPFQRTFRRTRSYQLH